GVIGMVQPDRRIHPDWRDQAGGAGGHGPIMPVIAANVTRKKAASGQFQYVLLLLWRRRTGLAREMEHGIERFPAAGRLLLVAPARLARLAAAALIGAVIADTVKDRRFGIVTQKRIVL